MGDLVAQPAAGAGGGLTACRACAARNRHLPGGAGAAGPATATATAHHARSILIIAAIAVFLVAWARASIDVVRRGDLGLGAKAGWAIAMLILPFAGLLLYTLVRPSDAQIALTASVGSPALHARFTQVIHAGGWCRPARRAARSKAERFCSPTHARS
jgi:hypothetical protein